MMKGRIMNKESSLIHEIFIALITTILSTLIISWFINPLTNWLFPKILKIMESFASPFVDLTYQKAATLTFERTGLLNLVLSITCICYLFLFSICLLSFKKDRLRNEIDDISAIVKPRSHFRTDEESLSQLKESHKYLCKLLRIYKKMSVLLYISMILVVISMIFCEMTQIYEVSLSTKARTNIEIVAPYISDQEYKQLKSDFFTIKNKSDYDNLQNTLNMISDEHSLDLKE